MATVRDKSPRHLGFYIAMGVGVLAAVVAWLTMTRYAVVIGFNAFFAA
jgi:uncharacterized membrane protein